jgi:hypothetical protein
MKEILISTHTGAAVRSFLIEIALAYLIFRDFPYLDSSS